MRFQRFTYASLGLFVLVASPFQAVGTEQIPLDPTAPPKPPVASVTAVVAEPSTSRHCTLRLLPNGVVTIGRPCGLDVRLEAVKAWRMTDDAVELLDVQQRPVLSFERVGPRSFKTPSGASGGEQLILTMLPASSMPLSGP